ncbi:ubiquitin carboxyl-terminal hydrolase [Infundibulicybe gibba]|nr:ubiquitin carboxyl-terminal hydrolase [Infundibulicybe gibba]
MATKITWIPLESNPEVDLWSEKAGLLVARAKFSDIYGLDSELLDMVPKPVHAVVLLFPLAPELVDARKVEDARIANEGQPHLDQTIFWMKQTISNACGTMALIHALANARQPLAKFIAQSHDKSPEERARLLESTSLFANIHLESASTGQTSVPTDLNTDLHFACFVEAPDADFRERAQRVSQAGAEEEAEAEEAKKKADEKDTGMRLIELDGTRGGPIDRGPCKNLLEDAAEFIKKTYMGRSTSLQFSMMSLGQPEF